MMLDVGGNEHYRLVDLMKYQIFVTLKKRGRQYWKTYSILCLRQSNASTSSVKTPTLTSVMFFIIH